MKKKFQRSIVMAFKSLYYTSKMEVKILSCLEFKKKFLKCVPLTKILP